MDQEIIGVALPSGLPFGGPEVYSEPELPDRPRDSNPRPLPGSEGGAVVGLLLGLNEQGVPLVLFDGAPGGLPVSARSVAPLSSADLGRDVVLLFEQGDAARPLVMGVLRTPRPEPVRTEVDGEKLVFTADREIVLLCGEASITLTRAGKVLIQGAYVLTRSSGSNRIKGAVVEIN